MLLRTRFQVTGSVSIAAILVIAGALAWSLYLSDRAQAGAELARSIMREQYERSLLRDEYLLTRGERARMQWAEKTSRLKALLDRAETDLGLPEELELVGEMVALLERTAALFVEIAARDGEAPGDEVQRSMATEFRERSSATLRIGANDLYVRARRLADYSTGRLKEERRRTMWVVFVLLGAVSVVTFVNTRLALITLERRVVRLREGAEQVAAGRLDHRIAIRGDDELAALGESFDRMTERLQRSHLALEVSNRELEAFSFAVSHDLRAPLRSISGFSRAVLEDYGSRLDEKGRQYLTLASDAAREMGQLIDDLLALSRVSRVEMVPQPVDLSALALAIVDVLRAEEPDRKVEVEIAPGLVAAGDPTLLRLALENLLRNSWKFTSRHPTARLRVGRERDRGKEAFFVADDGAGFDEAFVGKLFQPFQRLHRAIEFPGSGIGLATVSRIVRRHGGEAWARGAVEKGATIYFTLPGRGSAT